MYLKYDKLPHYPWKKHLNREWKEAMAVIGRVNKVKKVNHWDLLPYILNIPTLELKFQKIGLLFWYIDNQRFDQVDLEYYIDHLLRIDPPKADEGIKVPEFNKLKEPKNIKTILKGIKHE